MKRITNILISVLMVASLHSFGEDDGGGHGKKSRRYPRRRYYTKTINVLDKNTQADLKVEEPKEDKDDQSLSDMNSNTPLRDLKSPAYTPHPRMNRPAEKPNKNDDSNWIFKALTEPNSDSKNDDKNIEGSDSSNWGWLAADSKAMSDGNNSEQEQLSEEEMLQQYVGGGLDETLLGLIDAGQLNLGTDGQDGNENTNQNSNVSRKKLFVDFEETADQKFNIFKSNESDPASAGNINKGAAKHAKESDGKDSSPDISTVSDQMSVEEDMPPNDNPHFFNDVNTPAIDVPIEPPRHDSRTDLSNILSPPRDNNELANINSSTKFNSPFDNGTKFKSPFEESYNRRGLGTSSLNNGYSQPDYAKPLEPIGGGYSSNKSKPNDFGLGKEIGTLPDTFRESRKRLPNSINQWD